MVNRSWSLQKAIYETNDWLPMKKIVTFKLRVSMTHQVIVLNIFYLAETLQTLINGKISSQADVSNC